MSAVFVTKPREIPASKTSVSKTRVDLCYACPKLVWVKQQAFSMQNAAKAIACSHQNPDRPTLKTQIQTATAATRMSTAHVLACQTAWRMRL
jgi:hypothetical protein